MRSSASGAARRLLFVSIAMFVWTATTGAVRASEVVVANIVSRGFDVLLRTATPPESSRLEVFRDAGGGTPDGAVIVERQALLSGATEGDDYERRTADRLTRAALTEAGNSLFRVGNAEPDTVYYVRLVYDSCVWPESGLHAVRTVASGAWRDSAHQLLVDFARPGTGWIGTLAVTGAVAPLLAVAGDGAPTNSCLFFDLANWVDAAGEPFAPADGAPMTLRLFGKPGTPVAQRMLTYVEPASGVAAVASFDTELTPLLQLMVASAVSQVSDPPVGASYLFDGNTVTCRLIQSVVTGADTQFVGLGWSGTGSVPVSGRNTEFSFQLTMESTLDWTWRTNLWVEVVADRGSVDVSSGWYRLGGALTAKATPDAEWLFDRWSGLGSGTDATTIFTLNAPGRLQAEFEPILVAGGLGMPEWWLTQAGLSGAARGLHADPDGDGLSNLQEWLADTLPGDRDSTFRITTLQKAAGQVALTWRGGRESRQILEMLEGGLADGVWRPVLTNLPPTDVIGQCTVQVEGASPRFFRIRAER